MRWHFGYSQRQFKLLNLYNSEPDAQNSNLPPAARADIEPKTEIDDSVEGPLEGVTVSQFRKAVNGRLDLLEVSGISCRGLRDADWVGGTSDPYVVVVVGKQGQSFEEKMAASAMSRGCGMAKTDLINDDTDPDFGQWGCSLQVSGSR